MYISDNAIKDEKDDNLNRAEFSKKLGEQILNYGSEDSKVIAIYGNWGMGKTSILNIATSHIEHITSKWEKSKQPIIFRFNPWNFSEQEGLLFAFLKQLFSEVNKKLPAKKKDFQKNINELAKVLGAFENIPIAGIPFGFTSKTMNIIIPEETLESLREKIDEFFKELDFKIIIIIDDIDRLTESEIRSIFQLIKINADFPNTLYLVAFDRQIVENALSSVQGDKNKGRAYIEKIVQVAFDLPKVEPLRLERLLGQKIDEILAPMQDEKWDKERWIDLYHSGFKNLFENLRDVKRFINSLSFTINIIQPEINLVDFICLEAIRVFLPDTYYLISKNKDLFTSISGYGQNYKEKQEKAEIINQIFKESESVEKGELAKSICLKLFPPIQSYFGGGSYSRDNMGTWRSKRRVCSAEVFDIYFLLGLPEGEISQEKISTIIKSASDKSIFLDHLSKLVAEYQILNFLNLAQDRIEDLNTEHIKNFVETLVELKETIADDIEQLSSIGSKLEIARLVYLALMKLDNESRCELFGEIIDGSEYLYQKIFIIALDSPSKDDSRRDAPLFDIECVKVLQEKCVRKIEKWAKTDRLINSPELSEILIHWKDWTNETTVKEFVANATSTSDGLISYIQGYIQEVNFFGNQPTVKRQINIKKIGELINPEEIMNELNKVSQDEIDNYEDIKKDAIKIFRDCYSYWLSTNKTADFPYLHIR